jgi:Dockerin type I domain/PEP-CTERM motif
MFNMLLHGYTWAEAAWAATQQLSYVNTVVGDPLMTWTPAMAGDINDDGTVGAADLAVLAKNYGSTVPGGGASWGLGDFNGDGKVDAADLALFAANWGKSASWANGGVVGQGFGGIVGGGGSSSGSTQIPEPSTLLLAALAALLLAAPAAAPGYSRRRQHR